MLWDVYIFGDSDSPPAKKRIEVPNTTRQDVRMAINEAKRKFAVDEDALLVKPTPKKCLLN